MKKKNPNKRYCFRQNSNTTTITVPRHIVEELDIENGEEPIWDKALYRSEEKKLKIKITRGETIYEE